MTNLVLLSVFITTNVYTPQFWMSAGHKSINVQDAKLITNMNFVVPEPQTNIFTNYVFGIMDGTNKIELLTVQKERKK